MPHGRMLAGAALAAVLALSGLGSILLLPQQPGAVEAVDLTRQADDRDPANRRDDDDVRLEVAEDDSDEPTGDGDNTAGNDGTGGGNNTADDTSTGGGDTSN